MFGEGIIYLAIYLILCTLSSFFSVFPTSLSLVLPCFFTVILTLSNTNQVVNEVQCDLFTSTPRLTFNRSELFLSAPCKQLLLFKMSPLFAPGDAPPSRGGH